MSTGNPTFEEKMFTQPQSPPSVGMTFREAQNKYCNHLFEKNINSLGYPPINVSTDECQLCGISKDLSTPTKGR